MLNEYDCFALKGGTAINLFFRNMPRLSVDIDLTYLPIEPRDVFLKNITKRLNELSLSINKSQPFKIQALKTIEQQISKLLVLDNESRIVIEPNFVLRGSVFDCETKSLCIKAQEEFQTYFKIKTMSFADVYGGKICAALARQHPRDLFDVLFLLENEGITEAIRQAFVIYLASNSRPIHEILTLNPNLKNMKIIFEEGFMGMTDVDVSYESLENIRHELIRIILKTLTNNERLFLLSVKEGNPNFSLMNIPGIELLPGLEWKRLNIIKMDKSKHEDAMNKLKNVLQI